MDSRHGHVEVIAYMCAASYETSVEDAFGANRTPQSGDDGCDFVYCIGLTAPAYRLYNV